MSEHRIAVEPEVLTAHARRIAQVGADVEHSVDAPRALMPAGAEFGSLGGFLVPSATAAQAAAQAAVASAAALLDRAADQVRGWARDAEDVERDVCASVAALATELGSG